MKKILILTTLSNRDSAIAESALVLALKLQTDIVLLSTFELIEPESVGISPQSTDDCHTILQSRLKVEKDRLAELTTKQPNIAYHPCIETISREGQLAEIVWQLTLGGNYLLVVMGGKKSGWNDSYLCTELIAVTARSNCPVLVVGEDQMIQF
ncbi:hypothetical protein DU508_16015 [Pedobacter chinensis]|uniref:UspA domain-containing protein n=1 Tax=Pedobacter chinensis TaxID=2282421 RepID=A0A369PT83_9SPHI|nr:universal stress protein [Pedobacter chinensis]RDC55773.1 hypothetical protein DU508_16015 [Pedobacter chinensis]